MEKKFFKNIFMDSKMKRLMTHPMGPKSTRFFVNDPFKMPSYLRSFEYCGLKDFILTCFYEKIILLKFYL